MKKTQKTPDAHKRGLPGQVVLVLQGGGALGAYQAGVYEALHEAGIEPDWVIGTSIGAINAALIAGNPPEQRLECLRLFWESVVKNSGAYLPKLLPDAFGKAMSNLTTMAMGIPTFFEPNLMALFGPHAAVGIDNAAYYSTAPLRKTLENLVDLDLINSLHPRISLGAVNIRNGEMTYFDSREEPISIDHVLASGALPPAFPAIRIKDDYYWDGGVYSNTPIEAVLDDKPRHDSLIFAADIWNLNGENPESLWQVCGREKDIRYASRANHHIARQKQIHHLRHIISELSHAMPEEMRNLPEVQELASWGCQTQIHIARLLASELTGEDQMKDIDFTSASVYSRWQAGKEDTKRMLDLAPWERPVDPVEGVIIHDLPANASVPIAKGPDGFECKTR